MEPDNKDQASYLVPAAPENIMLMPFFIIFQNEKLKNKLCRQIALKNSIWYNFWK